MPESTRPLTPAELLEAQAAAAASELKESEVFAFALSLVPLAFAGVDLTKAPDVRAAAKKAFDAAKVIAKWRANK